MGCSQDLKATGLVLFKNLVELRVFVLYLVFNLLEICVVYSHWVLISICCSPVFFTNKSEGRQLRPGTNDS